MFKLIANRRNMLFKLTLHILLFWMLTGHPVLAADPTIDPPPETTEETAINKMHNTFLREGNYAQLDKEMNQIQHEYEEGLRNDINLLHLSYAFYDTDPALETKFNEWIEMYPQSYAARTARGIYLRRIARTARGTAYVHETPKKQIDTMQYYLDLAMEDLQQSLLLSKKPLLTHYNILCIARLLGQRLLGNETLKVACKIDPKNFIIRYKYMGMLQTRWGGSLQEMQLFRKEINEVGFPNDQLQLFDDLISNDKNWLAEQNK